MSTTILTVAAGTSEVFESPVAGRPLKIPLTVAGFPALGGSWTVEIMVADGGTWSSVDDGKLVGTLTAHAIDKLDSPMYGIRFNAFDADLVIEMAQQ